MSQTTLQPPRASLRRAAYMFGHFAARFPASCRTAWQLADGLSPLPDHLAEDVALLGEASQQLLTTIRGSRRTPTERSRELLVEAAQGALELVRERWNGDEHQNGISFRNTLDEILNSHSGERDRKLDPGARLAAASVFAAPCWQVIEVNSCAFAASLPPSLAPLAILGRATALAFDDDLNDAEFAVRLERIQERLVDGVHDSLLSTLRLPVSARAKHQRGNDQSRREWVRSQVWNLHNRLCDGLHFDNDGRGTETEAGGIGGDPPELRIPAAVGLLVTTEMSLAEVARATGANRSSLYRVDVVKRILAAREETAKAEKAAKPRGRYIRRRDGERALEMESEEVEEID